MKQILLDDDADEDVCKYKFIGMGRLILNTIHGEIIIDIRRDDVSAFVLDGKRIDFLLLKGKKNINPVLMNTITIGGIKPRCKPGNETVFTVR